jgi:26S proteasome non-ATPase regulatory subunit 10
MWNRRLRSPNTLPGFVKILAITTALSVFFGVYFIMKSHAIPSTTSDAQEATDVFDAHMTESVDGGIREAPVDLNPVDVKPVEEKPAEEPVAVKPSVKPVVKPSVEPVVNPAEEPVAVEPVLIPVVNQVSDPELMPKEFESPHCVIPGAGCSEPSTSSSFTGDFYLHTGTIDTEAFDLYRLVFDLIYYRQMPGLELLLGEFPWLAKDKPVYEGKFLVHMAVEGGYLDLVRSLVMGGVDVNSSTVSFTKFQSKPKSLSRFRSPAPETLTTVESTQMRPIHFAVTLPDPSILAFLLARNKILVDAVDGAGWTPLMHAVVQEKQEMVEMLLAAGANPNHLLVVSDCGSDEPMDSISNPRRSIITGVIDTTSVRTILNEAIKLGHSEIAKLLISNRADPSVTDSDTMNALHTAIFYNREDFASWLLTPSSKKREILVNSRCGPCPRFPNIVATKKFLDWTPLHLATYKSLSPPFIDLLISSGAETELLDRNGKKAKDLVPENEDLYR